MQQQDSTDFPSSWPAEVVYTEINSLYPSSKKEVRVLPISSAPFTSGGNIQFTIPKTRNSFLNPATLVLKFYVTYTTTTGGTAAAVTNYVLGGAFAHFSRITTQFNNINEIIDAQHVLSNIYLNSACNVIDKHTMLNLGFDAEFPTISSNLGCKIVSSATANTTKTFTQSYSMPINCVLTQATQMIPLDCREIGLTFTVNDPASYTISVGTTGVAASNITNIAISDCELVFDVLEFEETPYKQLLSAHGYKFTLKSNYTTFGTSQQIELNKSGMAQIGYSHQLSSLKKIIWQCIPNDSWEKDFGGVNPNLDAWNIRIGNNPYPSMPIPVKYASEAYYQVSKSMGSIYSTGHSGTINRNVFAKSMTAYNDYLPYKAATGVVTSAAGKLQLELDSSNKFFQMLDIEKVNQLKTATFSGIDTKGVNANFNFIITTPTTVAAKLYYWSIGDCALVFDMNPVNPTVQMLI